MGLGGGNNMENNGLRGGSGGAPGRKLRVSCSSLGSRSAASTAPEGQPHFLPHDDRIKPTAVAQYDALIG